ncbi:hypothetical protein [Treponema sp. Marseille-Q4523]|uniref:hypothetical protein n=1 Tax=Treponema sp. Marseille-Q4523 TaxID=2810610 RepID=UPI001960D051|nr:hypothetical protein [Treponema sp. Marseille-Q4523]MBM7022041.1 hypothetical protein [Treponema sp. Marseille-Q4523]
MYLFLIVFMPLSLVWYLIREKDKAVIPVAIAGALSSIVFCAFKAFFSFSYRTPRAGFFVNYVYILLAYTLIPVAAVYLVFLVLSKDDDTFLVKSYFPLLCAFFSVYLPYTVLSGSRSAYSAFELFCKPVLYTAMLVSSAICVFFLYRRGTTGKRLFIWILALALSLFVPAAIEAAWFIGLAFFVPLALFGAYVFFSACGAAHFLRGDFQEESISIFLPKKSFVKIIQRVNLQI